jgi:hypothetical protein
MNRKYGTGKPAAKKTTTSRIFNAPVLSPLGGKQFLQKSHCANLSSAQ